MPTVAIAWLATGLVFAIADAIWLSQMGPRFYRPMIGEILADKPNVPAMIAFYLIYVSGIVYFAVSPALREGDLMRAVVGGAALGLVAYATYDLSNQATIKVWDTRLTLIDLAWGTFATGLAAGGGYWLTTKFA
jgi:uncharacterized membrane protein